MKKFKVIVSVKQIVPDSELDRKDVDEPIVGKHAFEIHASTHAEAQRDGLDQFHWTVPIACLENYEITAEVQ